MSFPSYAELHCLSHYTFLQGASSPEELVRQAQQLGYSAIAITDECTLSAVVRAHVAAKESAVQLLIGSRFFLEDGLGFVLIARSRLGYAQLSQVITIARKGAVKGRYKLDRAMLEAQSLSDCLALWLPAAYNPEAAEARWLQQQLPGRVWIAVELLLHGRDRHRLHVLQTLGESLGLPLVASGAVYMHTPERRMLRDTLTAIRLGTRLTSLGRAAASNNEQHLRSRERLAKLYPPELLQETLVIAQQCHFSLDELRYEYPHELVPAEHSASSWLRELSLRGLAQRWPEGAPERVRQLLEKELQLVAELGYEHFFLTVHDIVVFARSRQILCQGRGSAANSVICYCLGITAVDPARMQLLFERFLSKERNEPPDIDVDFEHERREEVIQYIYSKYGRHRAALAAAVICYRARSAVRDVASVLGFTPEQTAVLSKGIDWYGQALDEDVVVPGLEVDPEKLQQLFFLVRSLLGVPRHLSQHVGGFVISQGPLSELVPVENAAMADRTVIQWEKDDLEALGLLKVDVLALGMLTAIRKSIDLINASPAMNKSAPLSLHNVPKEDAGVYEMMCAADTVGVFQIESRAQMSMLPRLKPRNYYDLVVQIAIVRPGPIQGNMVHPYLARRSGKEPVVYPNEQIKEVLERTLGVPIFQEQVMKIAIVAAGFSGGEADQLRRAMAAWKKKGGLEPFQEKLAQGMRERGYEDSFAQQIYSQIKGFADYGFPESHSASFALLAYVSSWLKCYHPAAFVCALLNSQPMGFYGPAQLVQDARRHGVTVLPVDVNHSEWDSSLLYPVRGSSVPVLRLGLRLVKGLSFVGGQRICEARRTGAFVSVQSLVARSAINRADRESLAAADAFKALATDRYRAFWDVAGYEEKLPLFADQEQWPQADERLPIMLPKPSEGQNIIADYNSTGLTLRRHPLALLREHLQSYFVVTAQQLLAIGDGERIKVAGIVTSRQRPQTASGVTFMTLEDETGFLNVVVWPTVAAKNPHIVRDASMLGVSGSLQISEGVVHVIANHLVDLSHFISAMTLRSRDFC